MHTTNMTIIKTILNKVFFSKTTSILVVFLCLLFLGYTYFGSYCSKSQNQYATSFSSSSIITKANAVRASTYHQLALLLKNKVIHTDSALYYNNLSIELAPKNSGIDFESQYLKAQLLEFKRDFATSISILTKLIQSIEKSEQADSLQLAQCYNIRGKMLRKNEVDNYSPEGFLNLEKALAIWKQCCPNKRAGQEIYREILFYATYQKDSITFNTYWDELHHFFDSETITHINTDRIKGFYLYHLGKNREAIEHQKKVLQKSKKNDNKPLIDQGYYTIANCFLALEEYDSASHYIKEFLLLGSAYEAATPRIETIIDLCLKEEKYYIASFSQLMKVYFLMYQKDKNNLDALKNAFTISQSLRQLMTLRLGYGNEEEIKNYNRALQAYYAQGVQVEIAQTLYNRTGEPIYLDWINQYIEQSKSILFNMNLEQQSNDAVPVALKKRNKELHQLIRAKKRQLLNQSKSDELANLVRQQELFTDSLRKFYPKFIERSFLATAPSLDTIQTALQQNQSCILQYFSRQNKDYVFIISPDMVVLKNLESSVLRDSMIACLQHEIRQGISINKVQYKQAAHYLYQYYIEPALPYLSDIKRLVVVPDDKNVLLPFEAFLRHTDFEEFDADSPFLIQQFRIEYAYSIRNYLLKLDSGVLKNRDYSSVLAMAFNSPKEKLTGNLATWSLPNSSRELEMIEGAFPTNFHHFRYGKKATEEAFLDLIQEDIDIIHLATHAYSQQGNPFDNRIYFRSTTNSLDTLYGYEVSAQEILASLVVLSSCQSAFGTHIIGEGVQSLTRSFIQAGSKYVVASIWNIDDYFTKELMELFYKNLKNATSPAEALHQAKLQILQNQDKPWANPAFWSLYVCY